jgi:hypothetical protein
VVKTQAADRAQALAVTNSPNALRLPEKGPVLPPEPTTAFEPPVLELLAALLRTRQWENAALPAWRQLEQCGLYPVESKGVAAALRSLVAHVIAPHYPAVDPAARLPIYRTARKQPTPVPATAAAATDASAVSVMVVIEPSSDLMGLPAALAPLLGKLGPYLADDPVLYTRVVRVLKVSERGRKRVKGVVVGLVGV